MRETSIPETVSLGRPTERQPWSRVRVRVLVLVGTLLIAGGIIAGVGAYHWWTHPTLFGGSYGRQTTVAGEPHTVESFALSRAHPGHAETVTFRRAPEPVWKVNTAGATLTVEICHFLGSSPTPGQTDFNAGPVQTYCNRVTPVRAGTTFRYPSPHEWLLAEVRAARPGRATLDTITYDYQAGTHPWSQRGVETLTFHLTFKVH